MRIIEGEFSGKHIQYNQRKGQRVTGEKVRKAVFDMLKKYIDISGLSVADVFAGSGMYGFEAISRGAGSVFFVDNNREAVKYIKENIDYFGIKKEAKAICSSWESFLSDNYKFDLVFMDPPYFDFDLGKLSLVGRLLEDSGILVIESSRRVAVPAVKDVVLLESRNYGDVRVGIYRKIQV